MFTRCMKTQIIYFIDLNSCEFHCSL